MRTINYGIDLGTTNSLIAKYDSGKVQVFKNPVGFRETLPSCIAFRGERTLIGDKAREWLLKDPLNVFAGFKRKMGTSEKYFCPVKNNFYSPIQLSSMVLAELGNFIHGQDKPEHIVITIPASFDTVQSNATKKAGYEAGFKEVVLLQEPIAASLAFFNKAGENKTLSGKWLVYDLGGGTFDVALIGIDGAEMRVIDHQGDNYLGGLDFDHSLVVDVVLPKLIAQTGITDLAAELNKREGKYEKLYYILLLKSEEAKKELCNSLQVEIEFSFDFGNGEQEFYIEISREELNHTIEPRVSSTIEMLRKVMQRNALDHSQVQEVIMIGGSTYIPYVRERVQSATGITVNCNADPTTAVAVGAAYYAGSKISSLPQTNQQTTTPDSVSGSTPLHIKLSYNKSTRDNEEYITGSVENFREGLSFRITRSDGGFDTGIKPLTARFGDFVTLRNGELNQFSIRILDEGMKDAITPLNAEITQGLFNLFGQPLPEDISIEVDDLENNSTKCQLIFERNSILPLSKTIYREVSRTIRKNSEDKLIIHLLEGNSKAHPSTNQAIGVIEIDASQLQGDLIRGSDVEIKIEMSESRDVSVKASLLLFNQVFSNVFSPTEKYISLNKLRDEIKEIRSMLKEEQKKVIMNEDFEKADELQKLDDKLHELWEDAMTLKEEDLSDQKYYIEEKKRRLAQQIYGSENNPRLALVKKDIIIHKKVMEHWCSTLEDMPDRYKSEFAEMKPREKAVFESNSFLQLDNFLKTQKKLYNNMVFYTPTLLVSEFHYYLTIEESDYTDPKAARKNIEIGEKALERRNYDEVRNQVFTLNSLLKKEKTKDRIHGTGLG